MVVGTWNLENLFRPGRGGGPGDHQVYDAKLVELARVIGEVEPDVLAVQEVGGPQELEDLAERLDGDWHVDTSEFPDGRGIRVGFLSRLALAEVEQVREFPEGLAAVQVNDDGDTLAEMGRGALRVRVGAEGRDIDQGIITRRPNLP
jgi:endonuclease/exonuclease/phosphatase family metal-dependent hydrolase